MIKLRLYRFDEYTNTFYYMTIHLITNKNEIVIMHNGNSITLNELNDLFYSSTRVEVVIENEKDINLKGVINNE